MTDVLKIFLIDNKEKKLSTTTRNSYFLSIEKSGIKLFLELNLG